MKQKAKLLFITSMGHSGSTLLDLLCGSIHSVFSMGEAHFLSWQLIQGEVPNDPQTYCSCGENFEECKFWSKILHKISEENNEDIFRNPKNHSFSVNRSIIRNRKNVFKNVVNKILELSLRSSITRILSFPIYWFYLASIKRNWDLFDKVADSSDSEYVVDSSKDILRFWLLRMHRPNDVKLIVLIRDLKGVASSSHHGLNQEIIDTRSNIWLTFYTKKIQPVFKYLNNNEYKIIKYEQLCEKPTETRNNICKFLGLENEKESLDFISPYNYHTIQGNPMRLIKKDIKIKYDERWRDRLTENQITNLDKLSDKLKHKYY